MQDATTHVADAGDLRKYRIELPNLIDDMDLSPAAFRLYVHLKRVAGAGSDGACWENTKTLAAKCHMSAGQVSKAKQELVKQGLITVEKRKTPNGPDHDYITLADMWPENFKRYAGSSYIEQGCSNSERACSYIEPKKEQVKKEPVKKSGADAPTPAPVVSVSGYPPDSVTTPANQPTTTTTAPKAPPAGLAHTHPAVLAYIAVYGKRGLDYAQFEAIAARVTDLERWQGVLTYWKGNGYRRESIANMLTCYDERAPKPAPANDLDAKIKALDAEFYNPNTDSARRREVGQQLQALRQKQARMQQAGRGVTA